MNIYRAINRGGNKKVEISRDNKPYAQFCGAGPFSWGMIILESYYLAVAILNEETHQDDKLVNLRADAFCREVIAARPAEGFILTGQEIAEWLDEVRARR